MSGTTGRSGVPFNGATGRTAARVMLVSFAKACTAGGASAQAIRGEAGAKRRRGSCALFDFKRFVEKDTCKLTDKVSCFHGNVTADTKDGTQGDVEAIGITCNTPRLPREECWKGTRRDIAGMFFVNTSNIPETDNLRGTANGKRGPIIGGETNHATVTSDVNLDQASNELFSAGSEFAIERFVPICATLPVTDIVADAPSII